MSEYYEGKYGPIWNKQNPPVSTDNIIAGGFYLVDECRETEVRCPCGKAMGSFRHATWGHGASGMLFCEDRPLDIPSPERMTQIAVSRKKLVEADLHHATTPAQNKPVEPA